MWREGDMSNGRPSLLERAAEIYDFESGLPMAAQPAPAAAPQRVRPVRVEPVAKPDVRPAAPALVRHARAELDCEALAAAGFLTPDAPGSSLAEEMRLVKRRLLASVDAQVERGDERARLVLVA